jgi:predicted transposase YbfD/YdcC
MDGKTVRGNGDKNQEALHIVLTWSKENGVCFGQRSEAGKGKEIPMILDLLKTVSVAGQIVMLDAMGTQKEIAQKIKEGRGDYVLAVQGNQGTLHEELKLHFEGGGILAGLEKNGRHKRVFEKARWQLESREYWHSGAVSWLVPQKRKKGAQEEGWKGLASIGAAKTTRTDIESGAVKSVECRSYLSSLASDVNEFEWAVRGHWAVESMHWHLDVTFREDKNRALDKNAAENLNIVRKRALSILKIADLGMKLSLKKKRLLIGCDSAMYLQKTIQL